MLSGALVALGLLVVTTSAEAACSQADIAHAAAQVQQDQRELLASPVKEDDQTSVSPAQRRGVATFKDRLAALADAYMACAPAAATGSNIARDLTALRDAHIRVLPDSSTYGDPPTFSVRMQTRSLIGIAADFGIPCGDDAVLLVYELGDKGWQRRLRWQTQPYDSIAKAAWAFNYAISPPDSSGQWFVVVKSVAPWCSSTWSEIRYEVLRPADDANAPRIIRSGSDPMWWGTEDFGTVGVTRDEADIRFHSDSIDGGVHNRLWIRHFRVTGDGVARIQPVAVSPRDFVDEWIVSPWTQAKEWSLASRMTVLHAAHEIAAGEKKDEGFEFTAAQKCSDAPDHYQITLSPMDESKPSYFQVRGRAEFTMLSVDRVPSKVCRGKNILATMATK